MTTAQASAIEELKVNWPNTTTTFTDDGQGNLAVIVDGVDLGAKYEPRITWIGFMLASNYPDPDVYPHYTIAGLKRTDLPALGEGFGSVQWQNRAVTQISRRTAGWNGATDSAAPKLIKVLDFVRNHP